MKYKLCAILFGIGSCHIGYAANNDMQGFLECLKPSAIYVESEKDGQLTLKSNLPVAKADRPVFVSFENGWRNETDDALIVNKNTRISLKKDHRLVNGKTNLFSHEDGSHLTSIDSVNGLVCDYKETGAVYLKGAQSANAFVVDKDCFDCTHHFNELSEHESDYEFVLDFSDQHQHLTDTIQEYHKIDLVDDVYSSATVIPKITHTIFVNDVKSDSLAHLRHNLKVLKREFGWQHFVWLFDDNLSPSIDADIKDQCVVRNVNTVTNSAPENVQQTIRTLQGKGVYSLSCYLSYYLANAYGGWYIDHSIELVQTLDRFSKLSLVSFVDQTFMPLLTPSLFGVSQNNPITQRCLFFADRLLNVKKEYSDQHDAYYLFGHGLFTRSFLDKCKEGQNLVLSPMSLLDCASQVSIKTVEDPKMKQDTHLIAIHFTDK